MNTYNIENIIGGHLMNVVIVNIPKIHNDLIIYSWHSSRKVPFFKKNRFYIKYQDINIEKLPIEYFWHAFLSIMIPVFSFCNEDVLFKFPSPIPSNIAELWINYHDASNIFIQPLVEVSNEIKNEGNYLNKNIGILFGGGKDSTYALSVLEEVYGQKNIVIISYVLPYMDNTLEKHDKRRDTFLLNPIKDKMKVKVQKIYTNFYANLTDIKYKYSTNMAIYFGTFLPVLLHHKISLVTFSYEFLSYLTGPYNSDEINFYYRRSRPEYTKYVSDFTSKLIESPLDIVNFNHYISEIGSFKVLAKRYPEKLQDLLMCENITDMKKWCFNCTKCGTYVLLSMCYGNKYMEININDFFEKSGYITKLVNRIDSSIYERNEDNNYPWIEEFCNRFHYESHCHIVASINLEKCRELLSDKAYNNLKKIKDKYGNKKFPIHESFIEPAFRFVSPPIPEDVKRIVTKYCSVEESLPKYFKIGSSKHVIDYSIKCNIPNIFDLNRNNKQHR